MEDVSRYWLSGVLLETTLPLVAQRVARDAGVDEGRVVRVRLGASRVIPTEPPEGKLLATRGEGGWGHALVATESGFTHRLFGAAELVVDRAVTEAVLHLAPSLAPDYAQMFLAGSFASSLALLRGGTVLHAGAVAWRGGAVALAGPSGMGKSTLLALMVAAGAPLVVDDALALASDDSESFLQQMPRAAPEATSSARRSASSHAFVDRLDELALEAARRAPATAREGGIAALPGSTELRFRPRALQAAGLLGLPLRESADGRLVARAPAVVERSLPLVAVLLPEPSRELTELRLDPLTPADALLALLALPRTLGWREATGKARTFRMLGAVSRSVPVARLGVPWGPPFARDLGRAVLDAALELKRPVEPPAGRRAR